MEHIEILYGSIEGARYCIASPSSRPWSKKILIYCHGYREKGIRLIADLDPREPLYKELLVDGGWIIAMTSYRRQGQIVKDAVTDVNNLRNKIVEKFGEPSLIVLEGRSMGGCIVTHLAELYPQLYHGVVAIGAALYVKENIPSPLKFTYDPLVPIIYLTNVSELGSIEQYRSKCKEAKAELIPALWQVSREGHNKTNSQERKKAIRFMEGWVQYGTNITARVTDATVFVLPTSTAKFHKQDPKQIKKGDYAVGTVLNISVHGGFQTSFIYDDLLSLRIAYGSHCKFEIRTCDDKLQFSAKICCYPYVGLKNGEWFVYEDSDGYISVEIFSFRFENPAHLAKVVSGDEIKFVVC
eukprot:TRINITY_DN1703_c0_g1_i2.p1 TRINITY_DN1703_c0_g1~~TRINITY_DN1703_c0_g1_i2.p1  ORF type:complete len:403 (-),score=74.84 TRINITY_DN1703_c0_g1_i2:128-1189(-)